MLSDNQTLKVLHYVEIPHAKKAALEALAAKNGRRLRDELMSAIDHHLAAPPVLRMEVPELPPLELDAPTGPAPRKSGRKPKAAPAEPVEPKLQKAALPKGEGDDT